MPVKHLNFLTESLDDVTEDILLDTYRQYSDDERLRSISKEQLQLIIEIATHVTKDLIEIYNHLSLQDKAESKSLTERYGPPVSQSDFASSDEPFQLLRFYKRGRPEPPPTKPPSNP